MRGTGGSTPGSSAILTVPNALSSLRILLIPVFCWLIVHRGTEAAGILTFTGRVSELGKVLDPVADRLAIAAGLAALVVRGAFPFWAAVSIVGRDLAVLAVGAILLARRRLRIDVRLVGKVATFSLMVAVPWIAWGNLKLPLGSTILVAGWSFFAVGIVAYYVAAAVYVVDIRRALARS